MLNIKFKSVTPETDLSKEHITKYNWDAYLHGKPYQIIRIDGFVHTIKGWSDAIDLWMYPRDEEPCYKNLEPFNGDGTGVCWGFRYEPYNYNGKYDVETNTHNYMH